MGFFSKLFGREKRPTADEWGLGQLEKSGADLSALHEVEFILSFAEETAARQAAARLEGQGFEAGVESRGERWRCVAVKTMALDVASLKEIHGDMNELAESLRGQYEGWGTL
jgi:hypothetical protein